MKRIRQINYTLLILLLHVCFQYKVSAQSSPSITQQPQSSSVVLGSNATFSVVASGQTPLSYQWSVNGTNLTDSLRITGATNSTLTVKSVLTGDAGSYRVVVSNRHGSVTSSDATLTIAVPPSISTQPSNQTVLLNGMATFTAAATGTGTLSYQWYANGAALSDGGRVSGATSASLTISNSQTNDAGSYQIAATNNYGSATSAPATLTVLIPPSISLQPSNRVALLRATTVFTAAALGSQPLSYQWQKSGTNFADDTRITGTTSPTLTISTLQMSDVGDYQLIVSNAAGTATSSKASLSIVPVVGWGDNTYNETNIPADFTNAITISAQGYTVEWLDAGLKRDGSLVAWGYFYNGIGDRYFGQTNLPAGLNNLVAVSAGFRNGLGLKSDGTVVGFGDNSYGEATPPGGLNGVVSVSAGGLFALALKSNGIVVGWGYDSQGAATPPAGLTNVVAISAGYFHSLAIRGDGTVVGWGYNAYGQATAPVGLNSVVAVSAGSHHSLALKSDGTVVAWGYNYYGQATVPAGLSNVIAIAAGYYHSLALKRDGTVVAWGNNDNGQATPPTGLSNVVAIGGGNLHSIALVENSTAPLAPVITWAGITNRTVPSGKGVVFLPFVTGSLPMNFQWYFNGAPLAAETNRWLALNAIQPEQSGDYQFTVSNSAGFATSLLLTVDESPGILSQPVSQAILVGGNANFNAAVLGVSPLSYQWYFNASPLADGLRVSGSTTTNLSISNLQASDAGSYVLVVTNSFGAATSAAAQLSVLVPAAIATQPTNQAVLLSSNAVLTAGAVGTAPLVYQWTYNGAALPNGGRISGSTTASLTIANAQTNDAGSYQLLVTNNYGSSTSAIASLTVLVPASIVVPPTNQSVLVNSNVSFVSIGTGTGTLVYQWYFNGTPLNDDGRVSGAATTNLIISNVQTSDAGSYWLAVTNDYGASISAPAMLSVLVPPAITNQPTSRIVLAGTNITLSVGAIGTTPLRYIWCSNGIPVVNGIRITGVTTPILSITNVQPTDSADYSVVVSNAVGMVTSSVATLTVLAPAQILAQPISQAVLRGSNVTFTASVSGSALNYSWFFNGALISDGGRIGGSTTTSLSITNVQTDDAGAYILLATNLLSSATSRAASLTALAVMTNSIRYVSIGNTNPVSPFLSWSTAATNIQDAVDASVDGDLVLATNGVYNSGSRVVYGAATNRVVIDKAITVQSVNGSGVTIIQGNQSPPPSAPSGMRCAYLTNGARLVGFTLTNGATSIRTGDTLRELSGGGVWCAGPGAIVSNCVLSGNSAYSFAGGACQGTLVNCVLTNNLANQGGGAYSNSLINCQLIYNGASSQSTSGGGGANACTLSNCLLVANHCTVSGGAAYGSALNFCVLSNNVGAIGAALRFSTATNCVVCSNAATSTGGGAYDSTLVNCVISNNTAGTEGGGVNSCTLQNCVLFGNSAHYGGGAFASIVQNNCTIVSNSASISGGGFYGTSSGAMNNSIVYYNTAPTGSNYSGTKINYCCTVPILGGDVTSFTNAPLFVDVAHGNLHLQSNSPCINAGGNSYVTNATDVDGHPRIIGGTVDIGAYEFTSPSSILSYAWAQQFGIPIDGSADFADSDGDGLDNWQEWRTGTNPTNSLSLLKIFSPTGTNGNVTITWQSVVGKVYFVQRSTNWGNPFQTIQSNINANGGVAAFKDTNAAGPGPFFYRIGVQAP